jgi:nucleotide-binding universal stress UspA family protein
MTKLLVSYDGTDADRDALELGRLLARAGASLELAYVRHAHEAESGRERLAENEAEALLQAGASAVGLREVPTHVVLSASTSEGLRSLALDLQAEVIVFGSEYRTARSHVDPQASARRLIDGGPLAVALAPAGFAEQPIPKVETIVAITEDGDTAASETAETLSARFGAAVARHPNREAADLLVVASKPGVGVGRVTISAAAEYVIELATCPVIVLPRGVAVAFDGAG